jgi:hypothetical protein
MRLARLRAAALSVATSAVLAAAPAVASAAPPAPSGPPDGAVLSAGTPVALHARGTAREAGLWLRVSSSPQAVDDCGRIAADVAQAYGVPLAADPALFDFRAGPWYQRPGTYFWQVHRAGAGGACEAAPVRRLTVVAASARTRAPRLSHSLIPRSIGASNHSAFTVRLGGIPRSVARSRFLALARTAGRRWRLRYAGARAGRPVLGNGRSEVGFATRYVPAGALAVTIVRRYRGGGSERDLFLRADLPWQQGPAHPTLTEVDLETVLLHEFGHVAGNRRHAPRCRDTPMIVALGRGEWWRSPRDFSFRFCGA